MRCVDGSLVPGPIRRSGSVWGLQDSWSYSPASGRSSAWRPFRNEQLWDRVLHPVWFFSIAFSFYSSWLGAVGKTKTETLWSVVLTVLTIPLVKQTTFILKIKWHMPPGMIKYQTSRWSINGVAGCQSASWPANHSSAHSDLSQDAGRLRLRMTWGVLHTIRQKSSYSREGQGGKARGEPPTPFHLPPTGHSIAPWLSSLQPFEKGPPVFSHPPPHYREEVHLSSCKILSRRFSVLLFGLEISSSLNMI